MRCPHCEELEDKVVDSRLAEDGKAIRRRRECLNCGGRFTTFERIEEAVLLVRKRDGTEEPYDRQKIVNGLLAACKNRPVTLVDIEALTNDVEEWVRADQRRPIPSAEVGREVLERLRELDEVAYLRFASVYKDFQELTDFEREMGLLQKKLPPKAREQA